MRDDIAAAAVHSCSYKWCIPALWHSAASCLVISMHAEALGDTGAEIRQGVCAAAHDHDIRGHCSCGVLQRQLPPGDCQAQSYDGHPACGHGYAAYLCPCYIFLVSARLASTSVLCNGGHSDVPLSFCAPASKCYRSGNTAILHQYNVR